MAEPTSMLARVVQVVDSDSAHWRMARWLAWTLLLAPLPVMLGFMALGIVSMSTFHGLVDEDGPVEWAQFVIIFAASIVFAVAAARAYRLGRPGLAIIYMIVALGSFVTAGEEISWGQRVFGWATPEVLEPINHQGESNIHNISIVQHAFNVGELVAGLYGLIIPIAWLSSSVRRGLGRWLDPILVPPICLVALFFLPFAYRTARYLLFPFPGQRIVELGEIPEFAFYLAVLLMGVVTVRVVRQAAAVTAD
jgi:hypothetical protein